MRAEPDAIEMRVHSRFDPTILRTVHPSVASGCSGQALQKMKAKRTVTAPERNWDTYAKFYPARVPYLRSFFSQLGDVLGLTKESFVLDLACGSGELAVGLAPYCGSVLGVDRSGEMLALRRALPGNVRLQQAELHSDALQLSRPANLVTIGRALHYLNSESLLTLLESATHPSASILICNSQIHRTTPWAGRYHALIAKFVEPIKHPDFYGLQFFSNTGWLPVRRPQAVGTVRCKVDQLLYNALSYPRYADVLLKHKREFGEQLRELFEPFQLPGGRVSATILSDGVVYRRAQKKRT